MERVKIPDSYKINEDISKYKEEIIKNLKSNSEIYSRIQLLGLKSIDVKKNLGLLLTFYEDQIVCQGCKCMENCPKEHPCFEYGLTYDGEFVGLTRSPCKKATDLMKYDSCFVCADFDDELKGKTLKDIEKTKVRNPILAKMVSIIKGESHEWLYIRGKINSGRTFMSVCFANEFASITKQPVSFCNTSKIIDELKELNIKNKTKFNERITQLETCSLLVFDGFGDEFKSDFNFSNVIFPILSSRLRKGLITVFNSDFEIDEIVSMYASKVSLPRAKQLKNILEAKISKELVLDGITLY